MVISASKYWFATRLCNDSEETEEANNIKVFNVYCRFITTMKKERCLYIAFTTMERVPDQFR